MKSLYFIKHTRPFNSGETASLPDAEAESLIERGAAILASEVGGEEVEVVEKKAPPKKRGRPRKAATRVKK